MNEVIPILLLTVCFPIWIVFHYITKMKTSKGLTVEDEKMLERSLGIHQQDGRAYQYP